MNEIKDLTPEQFRMLRESLCLTQRQAADEFGVSQRDISFYEQKKRAIPERVQAKLQKLAREKVPIDFSRIQQLTSDFSSEFVFSEAEFDLAWKRTKVHAGEIELVAEVVASDRKGLADANIYVHFHDLEAHDRPYITDALGNPFGPEGESSELRLDWPEISEADLAIKHIRSLDPTAPNFSDEVVEILVAVAEPTDWPNVPVLGNEGESHVASRAKKAFDHCP